MRFYFHSQTPITDDNVEEVSEELADLTEDSEDMTAEEVDSTADILQNITAVNSSEPAVSYYHHRLRLSTKFLARIRFLKRLSGKFRS